MADHASIDHTGIPGVGSGSGAFVGCRAYNSALQSISDVTVTPVTFDTEDFDTSGIHSTQDVLKMLMAGADVTMMCSALLRNGPQRLKEILAELDQWMLEHEYVSVKQMKGGMSQNSIADPAAFERANYMKALNSYK